MASAATSALGWGLGFGAGAVWGVAFFSWGLPVPIPARILATVLLVLALAAASRPGLLAAGAFMLGMATSSATLIVSGGLLFGPWSLVPLAAALTGLALHAAAARRRETSRG